MNFLTPVAVKVGRLRWLPSQLRYIVAVDKAVHRLTPAGSASSRSPACPN